MALAARVVLFTVNVPVAAPTFSVVAAPPKFSVVAPVFTRANVVDAVVRLVVIAGDVPNTATPVPVSSVNAARKFADDGVPKKVATPVPKPLTPVEIGKPVALVRVPEDGVPSAGVTRVGLLANTKEPEPVSSVTAAARFADEGVPKKVATPAPKLVMPVPPLATGNVPVTPVLNGKPVALVKVALEGVPSAGVTKVGLVANTREPEPVSFVTAAAKFAEDGVAKKVATPVPRPLTPVEIGKPVALVNVALEGVPKAGVTKVGDVAKTTAPVPVAVLKSVRPASQLAAVVPVMRIQVHIVVVPGKTVMTKFPPDELTVRLPVLLLTI